jgi:hypothetical protein
MHLKSSLPRMISRSADVPLQILTPCFPRLKTKVLGSGFLVGSRPSSTCVRFFLYKHKLISVKVCQLSRPVLRPSAYPACLRHTPFAAGGECSKWRGCLAANGIEATSVWIYYHTVQGLSFISCFAHAGWHPCTRAARYCTLLALSMSSY